MRIKDLLKQDKKMQKYFCLSKDEINLLQSDTSYYSAPLSRFDALLDPSQGLRVYELNTNCPATPGWVEMMMDVYKGFSFWHGFSKKYKIKYHYPWAKKVLRAILKNYKEWGTMPWWACRHRCIIKTKRFTTMVISIN